MTEKLLMEKTGSALAEATVKSVKLDYFDLKKWADGEDIEATLPEKHLFGIGEVYGIIGALIEAQIDGAEGPLKNDGNYNIFYTEKFSVSVGWWDGGSRWDVYVWDRDMGWRGDVRVFSPGLEA